MKKILSILLVFLLCISIFGCTTKDAGVDANNVAGKDAASSVAGMDEPSNAVGKEDASNVADKQDRLTGNDDLNILLYCAYSLSGYSNHVNIYNYISSDEFLAGTNFNIDFFECAGDTSIFESQLAEIAAEGKYDIILLGTYALTEQLTNVAQKFPQQHFLLYDADVDYATYGLDNVTSVQIAQNELAWKAGVFSALMTTSSAELINDKKVVGYVGQQNNTAQNDFVFGFVDGVNYVDSGIEVVYSNMNGSTDPALAKELAATEAQRGADIVFAVCGDKATGVMEAAYEGNFYGIGVDYDVQSALEKSEQPSAAHCITSAMKDFPHLVGKSLKEMVAGTYDKWGMHTWVDGSYGDGEYIVLLDTSNFERCVPADVKEAYNAAVKDLMEGNVKVSTAIGATEEEVAKKLEEAKPF